MSKVKWSKLLKGNRDNHHLTVRFDIGDGLLRISQFRGGALSDWVLLTPKQITALVNFLKQHRKQRKPDRKQITRRRGEARR